MTTSPNGQQTDPLPTVQTWLHWASQALVDVATDPHQEARWLLMGTLKCSTSDIILCSDRRLTRVEYDALTQQVKDYCAGQPLAYVMGQWSFCGFDLKVTPDTLIPRPETELLVELVLARVKNMTGPLHFLDLGTGTGAIGLALAQARPDAWVLATDCSRAALRVAQKNGQDLCVENIHWACMRWYDALDDAMPFDVIVSNPPYLRADDPHLASTIRHEPITALASGPTGLEALREIAIRAKTRVRPGGYLIMEHGFDQGEAAREIVRAAGFSQAETVCDLAGLDRIVVGRQP